MISLVEIGKAFSDKASISAVSLKEILANPCQQKFSYRYFGAPIPEYGHCAVSVTEGFRREYLRKYLRDCFGQAYSEPKLEYINGVEVMDDGEIRGVPVSIVLLSRDEYGDDPLAQMPNRWATLALDRAAILRGRCRSHVLVVNRNNPSKWRSYIVTRQGGAAFTSRALIDDLVRSVWERIDDEQGRGLFGARESECKACPFVLECPARGNMPYGEYPDSEIAQALSERLTEDSESAIATELVWELGDYLNGLSSDRKGRGWLRPSMLTAKKCDRHSYYCLSRETERRRINHFLRRTFDGGTAVHSAFESLGMWPEGSVEVRVSDEPLKIRGVVDVVLPDKGAIVELKSDGAVTFSKRTRATKKHLDQAEYYALMYGCGIVYLLYVCNDTGQMKAYPHEVSPDRVSELRTHIEGVHAAVASRSLPDQIPYVSKCRECEFVWKCKPELA